MKISGFLHTCMVVVIKGVVKGVVVNGVVKGVAKGIVAAGAIGTLTSCSGGGGDSETATQNPVGIGGSGIVVLGTIDGFGSIFVNGIEFETSAASIMVDNVVAGEGDLRLGMVVMVKGTVDNNGTVGVANSVEFDDDVQGPISTITASADGTKKTLVVLGVTILVEQTSTTFDGVSFDTLSINDVLEVCGFFDTQQVLHATRVEKKENFVPDVSEIEVKGQVGALKGNQFMIGNLVVDFSNADLSDVGGATLVNGIFVEVKGTLSANTITAASIKQEGKRFENEEDSVSLEGVVTQFVDISHFTVAGQVVNASNAQLSPTTLRLKNGVQVEVEGAIDNGVLMAEEVEARSGDIKLSAPVQSLDIKKVTGTLTLGFAAGSVNIDIVNKTELGDKTGRFAPLTSGDINVGDFLTVKALIRGQRVVATEVRLEQSGDQVVRAPVDSFVSGSQITLLGLTYSTQGAAFDGASSAQFFAELGVGDIIKIKDEQSVDAVADEVVLEN